MPGKSVSGAAVAMMALGGVAIWSGFNNVPLLDAFRALAKGQAPKPNRKAPWADITATVSGGDASITMGLGKDIVAEAEKWVGKSKYVYGGCHGSKPCQPGDGVDCSSFVTWVMYRTGHWKGKVAMVAGSSMLAWGTKIPNANRQPGDVVLWSGHHCGIVKDKDVMINAACTVCGFVRYDNYSNRKGWITLRAPDLAKGISGAGNAIGKALTDPGEVTTGMSGR